MTNQQPPTGDEVPFDERPTGPVPVYRDEDYPPDQNDDFGQAETQPWLPPQEGTIAVRHGGSSSQSKKPSRKPADRSSTASRKKQSDKGNGSDGEGQNSGISVTSGPFQEAAEPQQEEHGSRDSGRSDFRLVIGGLLVAAAVVAVFLWIFFWSSPSWHIGDLIIAGIALSLSLLAIFGSLRFVRGSLEEAEEKVAQEMYQPISPSKLFGKKLVRSRHNAEHQIIETPRAEMREHPVVLSLEVTLFIIWTALIIAGNIHTSLRSLYLLLIWLIGVLVFLVRIILWRANRFGFTDQRLILMLNGRYRKKEDVWLNKFSGSGLSTYVSILSRLLARTRLIKVEYCTLRIESKETDKDGREVLQIGKFRLPNADIVDQLIDFTVIDSSSDTSM